MEEGRAERSGSSTGVAERSSSSPPVNFVLFSSSRPSGSPDGILEARVVWALPLMGKGRKNLPFFLPPFPGGEVTVEGVVGEVMVEREEGWGKAAGVEDPEPGLSAPQSDPSTEARAPPPPLDQKVPAHCLAHPTL